MLGWLSGLILRLIGWRFVGEMPTIPKLVMIVSPHTSNWDFPVAILFKWHLNVRANYLGKHTLFRGPLGWFMRATGGVPVVRHEKRNLVEQVAEIFASRRRFWLGIAPAGTRSLGTHWRSGFYYIALEAKVPVLPAALDFKRKELRVGTPINLTGDPKDDMDRFRDFFDGARGCRPELATPNCLRVEEDGEEPTLLS